MKRMDCEKCPVKEYCERMKLREVEITTSVDRRLVQIRLKTLCPLNRLVYTELRAVAQSHRNSLAMKRRLEGEK